MLPTNEDRYFDNMLLQREKEQARLAAAIEDCVADTIQRFVDLAYATKYEYDWEISMRIMPLILQFAGQFYTNQITNVQFAEEVFKLIKDDMTSTCAEYRVEGT